MSETSNTWIFVLGSPRSGTSLLRRVLSSHRRLYISPELRVLELIQLAATAAANGRAVGPRELALGRGYARLLARHQLQGAGRARYGDKFPPYCLSIPTLDKLFPDAKFVHIIRDGRDVVSSLAHTRVNNRGWRREVDVPPTAALATDWATFVGQARRAGLALGPERYHELRYEHLTDKPVPVLRELMGFLGEEMEGSLLEEGMGEIKPGKSWRQTLAPAELLAFHEQPAARQLTAELGYPPTPLPADAEAAGETPAQERYLRGESGMDLWFTLGEEALAAGKKSAAIAHYVRAVRDPDPHPGALARLLAFPQAPESVFAAMNARYSADPALARAVAGWAVARGLSPAAAEALFAAADEIKGEAA